MNENEQELLDGLRALAAGEPMGAPTRLEQSLVLEFRKQVRRRRLVVRGSAAAAGALLVAAAALVILIRVQSPSTPPVETRAAVQRIDEMQAESQFGTVHADELANGFYPLPQAEALPAAETVMVVRIQMRMASLRLIGVPVNQQSSEEPVQADVLLGQDGLARGVRLIQ